MEKAKGRRCESAAFYIIFPKPLQLSHFFSIFASKLISILTMTAIQLNAQNTQLWQNIGAIADSEPLMKRLAKYVAKLVKEKNDSALMSKEEFYAKIERAEKQMERGEFSVLMPDEDVATHLKRLGYDI